MLQQTLLGQASNSRVDVGDDIDATLNTEDQVAERINQVAPSSSGEAKDRVSRDFFFPGIHRYRADGKYRGGTDRVRSKRNARSDGRMTPVRIESTADSTVRPFFLSSFLLQPLVSPLFSRHFPPHDESFSILSDLDLPFLLLLVISLSSSASLALAKTAAGDG